MPGWRPKSDYFQPRQTYNYEVGMTSAVLFANSEEGAYKSDRQVWNRTPAEESPRQLNYCKQWLASEPSEKA